MTQPISIIIVEDSLQFREGLRYLLNFSEDFDCIGDYSTAEETLKSVVRHNPDVILMDINLPGMNGIELTRVLKKNDKISHVNIIMLTILDDDYKVLEAILVGASGYLLKDESPEKIMDSIRQVYHGGSPMSSSIARKVFGLLKLNYDPSEDKILLNNRESEVLEGLVDGLTYKMIGEKYFIAIDTVRTYIRSIYYKLQVHSRSEAVVKAIKNRLL